MAALFLGLVGTLSAQNNDNLRGRINDRPNQAVQRRPNAPQKTDQRMPDRISDCQRDGLHGEVKDVLSVMYEADPHSNAAGRGSIMERLMTVYKQNGQRRSQSYLSNFMSIPTDCPQREKNGWTADAHISQEIGLLNFDSFTSYEKWLEDMIDNQRSDGQIADIIPSSGWGYGVNPVWSAALFIIPMNLYLYSGDLRPIERALPYCRNYLHFLAGHETERGSIAGGLGDWVPYNTRTPEEFTSTCYYYYINHLTARFCELLGQDGVQYASKAEQLKQLLNTDFLDSETGLYSNGSQAAQGTALYLGIVPQQRQQALAELLSSRMIIQGGGHLDFGMLGSKTVLRMLTRYGHVDQALDMARDQGVDLVEISPNAQPPVCRLIDYSKFLYQQKKRQKEMKAKQVKVEVKEIRFGPQTDEHDYQFKLKHAKEFLEEGNKVRAYVFFRGRSILFKEQGEVLLLRFANDLEEYGKVESMPSLEGKKMFLYLAPKKAGVAKKSQQKRDNERREAESKEAERVIEEAEAPANGGLLANAKISADALKKLTESEE